VNTSAGDGSPERAGYRRSAGSPRGEARRRELLERVTDDLMVNGLVDFSLRRAARAAGTTHKVLLYYFDGADDLLRQTVPGLRERRIGNAFATAAQGLDGGTPADRVRAMWQNLGEEDAGLRRVLDQLIGLAMYDPVRYAELGREASQQYLMPALLSICPEDWSDPTQARGRGDDPRDLPGLPGGAGDQRGQRRRRRGVRGPDPCAGTRGDRRPIADPWRKAVVRGRPVERVE
jgi:DNA-binding transcriptional regulator YbjK